MPDDRAPGEEPDPSVVWRWVGRATQPVVGWVLVLVGLVAMAVGWAGVSREVFPARQVPYLVSGGIFGLAMVFLGGVLIGVQDLRRHVDRIGRLERLVEDLHAVLLSRPDAPGARAAAVDGAAETVVALPAGSSFHRPDCSLVAGKEDARTLSVSEAEADRLSPCKLCEPEGAPAAAGTP